MFYFMSVHSKVMLDAHKINHTKITQKLYISKLYSFTYRTMNNQFNNRRYNISIIQNVSYIDIAFNYITFNACDSAWQSIIVLCYDSI